MINSVVIMGRLTADPELRTTQSGVAVTRFSIAVDRKFTKSEEKETDFIDVQCWRQTAEFVTKYFAKGSMIALQGFIKTGMYEDKNGIKRKTFEIVAENVSFCGSKNNSETKTADVVTPPRAFSTGSDGDFQASDDDLPF